MSATIAKVPTGVPGLDRISEGGIPEARSVLVVGKAGTGKTILGLQMASAFVRQGLKTILLAVEESPEDLVVTGDTLGFDLTGATASGGLRVSDATRPMEGPMVVSGEYDISGLVHRVEALVKATGARAVVLDSATALFSPRPPQELLRTLFFQLVHAFRRLGLTSVILAEAASGDGPLTTLGVEDYVCDMVIVLRNIVDGERRRRTVEINKYRRSAHQKGEYPFTITAKGISIFPLDIKGGPEKAASGRYSSGFPGLDTMILGGLFRDSMVIVRGPTGSGKTMLAGLYARAGAARGERVIYYGFEEPRPILLRNFEAIGMSLTEFEEAGNLRVSCRYPEAMGLEDLLVTVRTGLEEFQPSLVVLDSLSSIEHSASEKGFRQFMIGLASLLREHRRGALFTQAVAGGTAAESTAPFLSTIADTILALDYSVHGYELERTLRVLKMRGSAHDTHAYRLSIEQGGLKVEPPSIRPDVSRTTAAGALSGLHVLLVEDFDDAREAATEVLQRAGAEVVAVADAGQALAALGTRTPNVIVCDMGLPGEDGFALMERVRALDRPVSRVPAVAFTAWGQPQDRGRAEKAGFQAHLLKPVEPRALVETVARVAGRTAGQTPASTRS
jgi:circadian clock protein KaiC